MGFFKNPSWIAEDLQLLERLEDVPEERLDRIAASLQGKLSDKPLVSIAISAWNEELNIVRCLDSLATTETDFPFEIIVVNNNSTDRTQEVIDRLGVRSVFQPVQGWGPARQKGMEESRGKYVLTADSDCLYPQKWVDIMTRKLHEKDVVCVYGRYSFLGDKNAPRYQFSLYEFCTDLIREVRHIKRPYLNCYGMTMGYLREPGMLVKFVEKKIAGEDGRFCFDLMSHGKIKMVRTRKARVFTGPRSLLRSEKTLFRAFVARVIREIARFEEYFKKKEPHDTKTSLNGTHTMDENLDVLKNKYTWKKKVKE